MVRLFSASLSWLSRLRYLGGPLLEKELRVASRRRSTYLLRLLYVALIITFLLIGWSYAINTRGGWQMALQSALLNRAGRIVVAHILWLQFVAAQLVAVVLLSASLSEEIQRRTLGVLLTTPVTGFQIVAGKLAGRLCQLLLLLATAVPLLIVARIFGGIPLQSVVAGTALAASAALFAGQLSLLFSLFSRRPYAATLKALAVLAGIYFVLPGTLEGIGALAAVVDFSSYSPFGVMDQIAVRLQGGGGVGSRPLSWIPCCLGLLGAAFVLFLACVAVVRRVALRGITPRHERRRRRRVRRVRGAPVYWKELVRINHRRFRRRIGWGLAGVGLLVVSYVFFASKLTNPSVQARYAAALVLAGILVTVVVSAASIAGEREASTWPLLLTTPLSARSIVLGKLGGSIRRCLPVWGLFLFHVLIFSATGVLHPVVVILALLVAGGMLFFLAGAGTFFSTCFRKVTTAVAVTIGLCLGIWVVLPLLLGFFHGTMPELDFRAWAFFLHPLWFAAFAALAGCYQTGFVMRFGSSSYGETELLAIGGVLALFYTLLGFAFVGMAAQRLRRNVF